MDVIILDMGSDVKGESNLSSFEGKMELLSFSHGVAMQITGDISNSERTSGKPSHQDMTVTKYLDRASPVLNRSCCEGKTFPQVDIIIGRTDSGRLEELIRYTLKNVIISSVSVGGGGGDRPVETLTLNYDQITWQYSRQNKDEKGVVQPVKAGWNLHTNRPE